MSDLNESTMFLYPGAATLFLDLRYSKGFWVKLIRFDLTFETIFEINNFKEKGLHFMITLFSKSVSSLD